jgi:hypothetical protein
MIKWNGFLFNVMERMKVMKEFIGIIRIMFKKANVVVCFDGSISIPFKI